MAAATSGHPSPVHLEKGGGDMVELRRTLRGYEEVPPPRCGSCGADFRPGHVIVGVQHCVCQVNMHRSHRCPCGQATLTPPLGHGCRPFSLDGR